MKSIITSILLFFILNATAQSSYFNVHESQKYNDPFKSTKVRSVNTNQQNHTVIARTQKDGLTFEVFDENAKGLKVMIKELERKETFVAQLFYDDKVKIFTVYSPSKTERVIYCHIYDAEEHSYIKTEVFKTTVEKKRKLFSGQNKRQINFSISPNKNRIAIATENIKKNSNAYLVHVFDAQSFELLYSKEFYSNTDKHYKSNGMVVDDLGVVYNIGKEFLSGKRQKKNDKANYTYMLHKINKDDVAEQKIVLGDDEFIQRLNMTIKDSTLNLIGYYAEKSAYGIKGVCKFSISTIDLSVLDKKKTDLPSDVYKDLYGNNSNNKAGKELSSFDLDHILEDENGNTYLIAEEFYVTGTYVANGMAGAGTYVNTPHYDDILILKISASGVILWGRSIFKRANTPSYNVFLKDNELHVLLNSGKDLIEKLDGRTKVSKGLFESSALYDFVYDEKGLLNLEKIQNNSKGNSLYIPYRGNYTKHKFVMYATSNNKKQLMILESK